MYFVIKQKKNNSYLTIKAWALVIQFTDIYNMLKINIKKQRKLCLELRTNLHDRCYAYQINQVVKNDIMSLIQKT